MPAIPSPVAALVRAVRFTLHVRRDLRSLRPRARTWMVWIGALILIAPLSMRLGEGGAVFDRVIGSGSARANDVIDTEFDSPWRWTAVLVISGLTLPADSDSGRAEVARLLEPVRVHPAVRLMVSPANSLDSLLVGAGGGSAVALVGLASGDADDMASLRATTASVRPLFLERNPRLTLRWTGEPVILGDLRAFTAREVRLAERRALPVTAVTAAWAFGSLVLAGVAFVVAFVAVGTTLGLAGLFTLVAPVPPLATALVPLIGLALAIDYSLYLQRGSAAVVGPWAARRTTWLAATIVAVGFLGVAVAPTGEIRAAGVLCAVVAVLAAAAANGLTAMPRGDPSSPGGSGAWSRWGRTVVRHPLLVLVIAGTPVVFLAGRSLDARLRTPLQGWLPTDLESAAALEDLRLAGRLPLAATLRVVVDLGKPGAAFTASGWEALGAIGSTLDSVPGVADVRSIATVGTRTREVTRAIVPPLLRGGLVSRDERWAILDVVLDRSGAGTADAVVRAIRGRASAPGFAGAREVLVTGLPAHAVDFESGVGGSIAWIVVVVSLATFFGVAIALRAPVIALKAVALNLLVAGAAIGATVIVFQDGLVGSGTGSLFPTVPAVAFGATFGIGMDYELFLLGALLRARRDGLGDDEAIVQALVRSGSLVTRAAAIMLALFVAFALSDLLPLAMIGFALAVGVFLDATLVRMAMAPALIRLAGRWNWWWPGS